MTIHHLKANYEADKLIAALEHRSEVTLGFIISATPTGKTRDTLTEANLYIMKAIELIKKAREP